MTTAGQNVFTLLLLALRRLAAGADTEPPS